MSRLLFIWLCCSLLYSRLQAQTAVCSNHAARSWWDVQHYDLHLQMDTGSGYLQGRVLLAAEVKGAIGDSLQIDLDEGLRLTYLNLPGVEEAALSFTTERRQGYYLIKGDFTKLVDSNGRFRLLLGYEGQPHTAVQPPWDGGLVMNRDAAGKPWIGMACQDEGASLWFPCKNFQGDEPDEGMRLSMTIPAGLKMISNGRCTEAGVPVPGQQTRWSWEVNSPINNYGISFYIGDYVQLEDSLQGAKGLLRLEYFVLRGDEEKAMQQFAAVKPMLQCFESKFGPYPFYKDGYKLVASPYLGMEHQSAVAYGNEYLMGYKGTDRSGTGVGLLFDFILVHESAHEWFGNSITAIDKADTWVHEGFTSYAETIFAECILGKEQAFTYQRGKRLLIMNDRPVQGIRDACDAGSGDHYDKGAYLLHMIRCITADDELFFGMLRSLNDTFYHQLVTGAAVADFISSYLQQDRSSLFDQYLRQATLPQLAFREGEQGQEYRWQRCVPDFDMPVILTLASGDTLCLQPVASDWTVLPEAIDLQQVSAPDFLLELVLPGQ